MPARKGSAKYKFSRHDAEKVAKGAGIAMTAAAATYLLAHAIPLVDTTSVGGLFFAAIASAALNALLKLTSDTRVL